MQNLPCSDKLLTLLLNSTLRELLSVGFLFGLGRRRVACLLDLKVETGRLVRLHYPDDLSVCANSFGLIGVPLTHSGPSYPFSYI